MSKETIKSQKIVISIVLFSFVIIFIKLSHVALSTTVDGTNIKAFANNRNITTQTLYAERGNIYDKDGDLLAQSVKSYTLIAYIDPVRTTNPNKPQHVVNKEKTARELAQILNLNEFDILEKLNKDKYQVEIVRNISEVVKTKIDALELEGIDYIGSLKRYYKGGMFASYLIGYAKTNDEGEIVGELGLEGYFDKELKEENGSITYHKDSSGHKFPNSREHIVPAKDGLDLHLTIDSNIQLILENAMSELSKQADMTWGSITVVEAKTGAILGSATAPNFDPNDLNTITSYINPLVSYPFEPGSTLKTFSFGAAIDSGNYNGSDTYKSGSIEIDEYIISDFNNVGWGTITYDKGFAMSSNVASSKIALNMGRTVLRDYYERLGFGKKTGIELFAEAEGSIRENFYAKTELATAAFGQGVTMTPIQLIQAFTTIANDGVMLKPYLVEKIVDKDGTVTYQGQKEEVATVFKKETTNHLQKLLHDAIYDGVVNAYQPSNVNIIGKTGTAQIASPKGGYLKGKNDYVRSFAALFPYEDPQYILYVAVKQYAHPSPVTALAKSSVKAIEEIASYTKTTKADINYKVNHMYSLENYISKKTETLKDTDLNYIVLGDGKYIIDQFPYQGSNVFKEDKIFIKTSAEEYLVPSLKNYTLSEVDVLAKLLNLKLEYKGTGRVISQSIEAGTVAQKGDILTIELN